MERRTHAHAVYRLARNAAIEVGAVNSATGTSSLQDKSLDVVLQEIVNQVQAERIRLDEVRQVFAFLAARI